MFVILFLHLLRCSSSCPQYQKDIYDYASCVLNHASLSLLYSCTKRAESKIVPERVLPVYYLSLDTYSFLGDIMHFCRCGLEDELAWRNVKSRQVSSLDGYLPVSRKHIASG
jgi:hypothetical protein